MSDMVENKTEPSTQQVSVEQAIQVCADKISDSLDADVVFINADIERGLDDYIIESVRDRCLRKNVFFILVTSGGDPNAAYRIARCFQDSYERVIAFIPGYCKSAGTLCVIGAHEIVMCDVGELGPLDVQLYKKDEIGELSSGLVALEALQALQGKAFDMFEKYFMTIKQKSGNTITFKTATETAIKITTGLLEPLYRQIDPLQVGEIVRSMKIAVAYGRRLMARSKNCTEKTLQILSESYPTHGFVIDLPEAKSMFKNVRPPTEEETMLKYLLSDAGVSPAKELIMKFLSSEIKGEKNETTTKKETGVIKPSSVQKTKRGSNPSGNGKNSKRATGKKSSNKVDSGAINPV